MSPPRTFTFAILGTLFSLAACGGAASSIDSTGTSASGGSSPAGAAGSGGGALAPACLQKSAFHLPADGTPNDNLPIGPFCCTGTTVILKRYDGVIVGYAYAFGFPGGGYQIGPDVLVAEIEIEIAAVPHLWQTDKALLTGKLAFTASELTVGAHHTQQIGALEMTATVEHADPGEVAGVPQVNFGTLVMRLDVKVFGADDLSTCPVTG